MVDISPVAVEQPLKKCKEDVAGGVTGDEERGRAVAFVHRMKLHYETCYC
jgi:hypothetical protein